MCLVAPPFLRKHTCHVFPPRDSTCRDRTVRSRTRRCHVAVFHATLGHLRCRRDAGLGQFAFPDGRMWFAERHWNSDPAHWASWADSLRMIHTRHPGVADTMVRCLVGPKESRHCSPLHRVGLFFGSRVSTLLSGKPFSLLALAAFIPGEQGWQHDASLVIEQRFVNTVVVPRASLAHRAMLRSQGGPFSGLPFTTLPLSPLQRFDSHLFRVLLLRRLHLPLPLSSRACRCGRPLDCLGPSPCKLLEGRSHWSLLWLGPAARPAPESQ